MKTAKLTVMFLACAAAIPAFAQNTTDSRCGSTNYDGGRNMFTITNPAPGTATQQCFITVVPKESWSGGMPDLSTSQLVEGNYEITLSGGGGGGGGGGGADTERSGFHRNDDSAKDNAEHRWFRRTDDSARDDAERGRTEAAVGDGGGGGYSAVPVTTVRYLNPGVYRMTIGAGGQGGMAGSNGEHAGSSGARGADGAPSSLSKADTGETVAGFTGAESWNGTYPLVAQAAYVGTPAPSGERGAKGRDDSGSKEASSGLQGGSGFIKLALKDPVPQAMPVQAAPAMSDTVTTPAPARPAKRDRN